MKGQKQILALTSYDFPTTQLLDELEIPLILVGDSLGMVVLGYPDTTHVTMSDMEHHVRAAARARPKALLAADLPYGSYTTALEAVVNAKRLMRAGAEAVKAEGGRAILPQVQALREEGIPFVGHLGMLPQSVLLEGGYHVKGKVQGERQGLIDDIQSLGDVGAFAVVLELVTAAVATELTALAHVPTIGIGSGRGCDGQILVTPDVLGLSPGFIPRHVKFHGNLRDQARSTLREWIQLSCPIKN
jgi:3-methyl-2-oxobutanoate hydroxymethyltransferase